MKSFNDFVKRDEFYRQFKKHIKDNYASYQSLFNQYSRFTPDLSGEDWMNTFDKAMTGDTISIMIMKKLWNSLPDELNPEKEAR